MKSVNFAPDTFSALPTNYAKVTIMEATAKKTTYGRPAIPFDNKKSPFRLFIKNGLIRRFEQAAPVFNAAHSEFAEMVIERGLDALEHDQTLAEIPYPLPQE